VWLFNQKYGRDKFVDHPKYRAWIERNGMERDEHVTTA